MIDFKSDLPDNSLPSFMYFSTPIARALFKPFGNMYLLVHKALSCRGNIPNWVVKDNFLFFLIALIGAILLSPRYLIIAEYIIKKHVLKMAIPPLSTSGFPYIPNLLIPLSFLFCITYFFSHKVRLSIAIMLALPLAVLFDGIFDIASAIIYLLFLASIYIAVKLKIQKLSKLVVICISAVLLLFFCTYWPFLEGLSIGKIAAFQATFIPMLWYSVYEELPPKRSLRIKQFLLYHYTRIFGAPVLTYNDLFAPVESLSKVRFDGIKAIYVAVIASTLRWVIANLTNSVEEPNLEGLVLLVYSYGEYVERYCRTWVVFNLFIGLARLFGIPVRDNFNYWLLARTPNEHWRRWNILMREWVITFIFFPIMRKKKRLFVATMASLLASGLLHLIPQFFDIDFAWYAILSGLSYWFINGLSIYVVIKFPLMYPGVIEKLRIRSSIVWSCVGIVVTSAFYGILHQAAGYPSFAETINYFSRLFVL